MCTSPTFSTRPGWSVTSIVSLAGDPLDRAPGEGRNRLHNGDDKNLLADAMPCGSSGLDSFGRASYFGEIDFPRRPLPRPSASEGARQ